MDHEHSGLIEYPSGDEDLYEQDAYDDWEDDIFAPDYEEDEEPEINDDFPMYLEYDDWKEDSQDVDSYTYENGL